MSASQPVRGHAGDPSRPPANCIFPMVLTPAKNCTQTRASILAFCHWDTAEVSRQQAPALWRRLLWENTTAARNSSEQETYIGTDGRSKASSFLLLLLFVPSVSSRLAALATYLLYLLAFTWSAPFICLLPSNSFSLLLSTCFSTFSSLSDSPSTHPTCSSLTLYSRLPK